MNKIDAGHLNELINQFVTERDWDQFHSLKNLVMALGVECAELSEIFQWESEAASNQIMQDEKKKERVEEELADIFYYLLRLSHKTNINLEEALLKKLKKNADKYPVELAKGNSKKYNEF